MDISYNCLKREYQHFSSNTYDVFMTIYWRNNPTARKKRPPSGANPGWRSRRKYTRDCNIRPQQVVTSGRTQFFSSSRKSSPILGTKCVSYYIYIAIIYYILYIYIHIYIYIYIRKKVLRHFAPSVYSTRSMILTQRYEKPVIVKFYFIYSKWKGYTVSVALYI